MNTNKPLTLTSRISFGRPQLHTEVARSRSSNWNVVCYFNSEKRNTINVDRTYSLGLFSLRARRQKRVRRSRPANPIIPHPSPGNDILSFTKPPPWPYPPCPLPRNISFDLSQICHLNSGSRVCFFIHRQIFHGVNLPQC